MSTKMTAETVAGAHAFTDEISALMQRLKGHLRNGRLDVLTVMEIMVLIGGLPKTGPFALFALACSTDEILTAAQFVERLHMQSERLAREIVSPDSMIPRKTVVKQPQLKGVEVRVRAKDNRVHLTSKVSRRDIPIKRQIFHIRIQMRMIVMRPKT